MVGPLQCNTAVHDFGGFHGWDVIFHARVHDFADFHG